MTPKIDMLTKSSTSVNPKKTLRREVDRKRLKAMMEGGEIIFENDSASGFRNDNCTSSAGHG